MTKKTTRQQRYNSDNNDDNDDDDGGAACSNSLFTKCTSGTIFFSSLFVLLDVEKDRSECRWSIMTLNVQQLFGCIFGICTFSDQHSIQFVHVLIKRKKKSANIRRAIGRQVTINSLSLFILSNQENKGNRGDVFLLSFSFSFLLLHQIKKSKPIEHHVQFCYRYSCRYCWQIQ